MRGRKPPEKSIRRLPPAVYLAYLLVCSLLLTGVSFARYLTSSGGSDCARVAAGKIVVSSSDNPSLSMDRIQDDGMEARKFQFQVSNENSEVAIQYDVVVTLNAPLPEGVSMTLDGASCSGAGQTTFTFAHAGIFEAGSPATKTHTLAFAGDYDVIQESSTREITITVNAEQIN